MTRAECEGAEGRQWVAGYDGEHVYGAWLPPADEPVVVGQPNSASSSLVRRR